MTFPRETLPLSIAENYRPEHGSAVQDPRPPVISVDLSSKIQIKINNGTKTDTWKWCRQTKRWLQVG